MRLGIKRLRDRGASNIRNIQLIYPSSKTFGASSTRRGAVLHWYLPGVLGRIWSSKCFRRQGDGNAFGRNPCTKVAVHKKAPQESKVGNLSKTQKENRRRGQKLSDHGPM